MKRILSALIFIVCMIFPAAVYAQTSGNTPPPPPYCTSANAGALYTNTGTSPATVYTCSYYNLAWQWVVNPSYGGLVSYPTVPTTCSGALPVFLAGWPNTQMYVCVSGVPYAIGGAGVVTTFAAPSASWPTWLAPTVTNPTTTPSLAVAAGTVPLSNGGTGATTAAQALANLGGAPLTGTGTSGTWPISTTGNAATATNVPYSGLTGTVPTWNQSTTGNAANVTGTVALSNGGTGATTAAGALTNLGGAGVNQANTYTTGLQNFSAATMKQPSTYTVGANTITNPTSTGTLALTSQIPSVGTWGALNYPTWVSGTPFVKMTAAGTFALDTNTYGTVTSVALKSGTPNLFSGTPGTAVTGSGYLDPDAQLATQSANCVVAGPTTGSAAAPTCRSLVSLDIPNNAANTSGTAAISTSTNGFGGIAFSNTPAPALSNVICYDGVQYTPCPSTAGPAQILYLTNTASDISTYDLWSTAPLGAQFTVFNTIPATTTKTLIQAFATASGYPGVTVIPAGEWQMDSYAQVSSSANTTTMNVDVYSRTTGGVETLLFSFGNVTVSGGTTAVTSYSTEAVEPAFSIGVTDRLVIKYNMTKTGGASITGTVYGGGSTNYSHIHTPIGTASGGVSGGTAGQLAIFGSVNAITSSIAYATANTPSTIVARDGSGNFSAGTIAAGATTPTTIGSNGVLLNGVPALQSQTSLHNYYSGGAGNLTGTGSSNTANGLQALFSNTTGYNNNANGYQALYYNTTGYNNTANGFQALFLNTTGYDNNANGFLAGLYIADGVTANQTSNNSVYEGFQAYPLANGDTNENVIGNGAIGHGSNTTTLGNASVTDTYLAGIVHGTSFTGNAANVTGTVAAGTATPTTIGSNGVLLNGVPALQSQTSLNNYYSGGAGNLTGTGNDNTANGFQALYANTTGSNNTANGWTALYNNTTGYGNTANGWAALYYNTLGNNNTANGLYALALNTTGNSNTANGYQALNYNTTGSNNTANGFKAGQYIADGVTANQTSSNSVYEGFQAYPLANGDTNENVIGNTAIGHGSNTTTLGNASVTDTYLAGTVHGTSFTGNAATATTSAALSGTLPAANGGTGEAGTITGVLYGNGTSAHTAATAAQIVAVISTTPVANATAATTAAALSVPLAHAIVFPDPNAGAVYTASQVLSTFFSPMAGTVPAGGAGTYNGVASTSVCKLTTAATASTTFTFADNGTSFGTVVFAASGTTGTFTISSAKAIASGDKITLTGPATADTTAAGLNCSLVFAY